MKVTLAFEPNDNGSFGNGRYASYSAKNLLLYDGRMPMNRVYISQSAAREACALWELMRAAVSEA